MSCSLSSLQLILTVSALFSFCWSLPIDDMEINSRDNTEEENLNQWTASSSENSGEFGDLFEGDIILGSSSLNQRNIVANESLRWESGIVPYELDVGVSAEHEEIIKKAMEQFHEHTCVRFKKRSEEDKDYVYITTAEEWCSSAVGRQGKKQILKLESRLCFRKIGTSMHELMHALGLWHEQSREDRDKYVDILKDNIKDGKENIFKKADPNTTVTFGLPYDYGSVMHYPSVAFSKNGKPTILPKDRTKQSIIGQRDKLSEYDIIKVNKMYKCKPKTLLNK